MRTSEEVPKALRQPGWTWTPHGLQVCRDGKRMLIPLIQVVLIFDGAFVEAGVPQEAAVGACSSVGGFLKKVGAGLKKFGKKLGKGILKAVKAVGKVAKAIVTNPVFRAGFAALATAVPILAPAAVGLEIGSRVVSKVEKGVKAAKKIKAGVKSAKAAREVKEGIKAKRAIERVAARAEAGDRLAQRAYGGVVGAKVASRAAKRRTIRQLAPHQRPRRAGVGAPWAGVR
jgi:hypothetical protein